MGMETMNKTPEQIVAEAPYHPGYEDAVMDNNHTNPMLTELNEFRRMNEKYSKTQKVIVDFIIESNKTK
jgi:hypothetical protein